MSSKPGKTAPRLIEDLYHHDPRKSAPAILTDAPSHYDPKKAPSSAFAPGSCHHNLVIKRNQSKLAISDVRTALGSVYKVASYCRKCRYHFDLLLDARDAGSNLCPNEVFPLHHFLFSAEESTQASHTFRCSADNCYVSVTVTTKSPRITKDFLTALMDPHAIERRFQTAKDTDPARAELKKARPIDPPYVLSMYLRDALWKREGKTRIPSRNKKFMVCFGTDCDPLLGALGFTYSEGEEGGDGGWTLPSPTADYDPVKGDDLHELLDDTRQELQCLVDNEPHEIKRTLSKFDYQPEGAREEIQRVLGSLKYDRKPRTLNRDHSEPHPSYYASLGAIEDFSDHLLEFAFDRQVATDPGNAPYYFECLEGLANGRNSESLDIKRVTLRSEGFFSRSDVAKACEYFGLGDITSGQSVTDEGIINIYQLRLADTAPSLHHEVREHLRVIGQYRESQVIKEAAADTISSPDQAFNYLGIDRNISDDWISTMAQNKMRDAPDDTEKIRHAVQIIADYRKSQSLNLWIQTGELSVADGMDVAKAYSLFGINDGAENIDLDVLKTQAADLIRESPEKATEYNQAVQIIQETVGKGPKTSTPPKYPPDQWPVGIKNLGNTCYLNAILQFLFTIRPLRQLVLDFQQYKMDLTPESVEAKRVGNRKVTEDEIRRSQQFALELRQLFIEMQESSETIGPRRELVQGALQSAIAETLPEHQSSTDDSDATLVGDAGGANSNSDTSNPSIEKSSEVTQELRTSNKAETLPEAGPSAVNHGQLLQDPMGHATLPDNMQDSFMDLDNNTSLPVQTESHGNISAAKPPHPDHKPPLPPRAAEAAPATQPADQTPTTIQQDAAEILNNVLLQMSYAIRAESFWEGEQVDLIKNLFYGTEQLSLDKKGQVSQRIQIFNNRLVPFLDRPKTIYEALDDDFDRRAIEGSRDVRKWTVMLRPPPVLLINIGRVDFDKEQGKTVRSYEHLSLDETIYLDRYVLPTDDQELAEELNLRREQAWDLKDTLYAHLQRIKELRSSEIEASLPNVLLTTSKWLSAVHTDRDDALDLDDSEMASLKEKLEMKAASIQAEIDRLNASTKEIESRLSQIWSNCKSMPYKLHSLFIHSGGASSGHYWVSIRDFKSDTWRKYNDETIESISDVNSDIFGEGNTSRRVTPTCAVYVKADLSYGSQPLVEALSRTLRATPKETEMTDIQPNRSNFASDSLVDAPITEGIDIDPLEFSSADKAGYEAQGLQHGESTGEWHLIAILMQSMGQQPYAYVPYTSPSKRWRRL